MKYGNLRTNTIKNMKTFILTNIQKEYLLKILCDFNYNENSFKDRPLLKTVLTNNYYGVAEQDYLNNVIVKDYESWKQVNKTLKKWQDAGYKVNIDI